MSGNAGDDGDLAELQQRLATFREQLASIDELLQSDPQNGEFLTIAQDLREVIQLTQEMINLKTGSAAAAPAASADARRGASQPETEVPEIAFSPGTVCEALSKGVWFPAFIESLTARDTYNVHYIGFGSKDELPASCLRAIAMAGDSDAPQLPPREAIAVGFKCQAKYYVDAQLYAAQVTAVTPHGFQVLFDGYGNSEEVPYEYLKPLAGSGGAQASTVASAAPQASHAAAAVAAAVAVGSERASGAGESSSAAAAVAVQPREAVVAKPIKVPENLQILPTDSEAEKERKKKRFKHIQKLNKQIEVDNTHNLKQHDWKSFQHKAAKGKVKGSGVLSKRGTSMFASPDSVQGRVGVVGSGQGMTQFEAAAHKKLKKSHLESVPRL